MEAAQLDGANGWQRFWGIIGPMIQPVIAIVLLLNLIWDLRVFTQITLLKDAGSKSGDFDLLGTYIYKLGTSAQDFGMASRRLDPRARHHGRAELVLHPPPPEGGAVKRRRLRPKHHPERRRDHRHDRLDLPGLLDDQLGLHPDRGARRLRPAVLPDEPDDLQLHRRRSPTARSSRPSG